MAPEQYSDGWTSTLRLMEASLLILEVIVTLVSNITRSSWNPISFTWRTITSHHGTRDLVHQYVERLCGVRPSSLLQDQHSSLGASTSKNLTLFLILPFGHHNRYRRRRLGLSTVYDSAHTYRSPRVSTFYHMFWSVFQFSGMLHAGLSEWTTLCNNLTVTLGISFPFPPRSSSRLNVLISWAHQVPRKRPKRVPIPTAWLT
jgi:hypothetical protein